MRNLIILLFIFGLTSTVFGQKYKFAVGLESGPSLIFLRGNDLLRQYNQPTLGFSGGLSFQYNFPKIFSIQASIGFEQKGSELNYNINFTDQHGNYIGSANYISHLRFDYIVLPVLFRATFGKKIKYFFNTGSFVGYLVKQTTVSDATAFGPSNTRDDTSLNKRFDTGVNTGLGFSIPIAEQFSISFELRNNLGLFNVRNPPIVSDATIKTNSTNLLFGFSYKFGSQRTATEINGY